MTIFYIDPVNGSDAGSGADWANAWKTIKQGATAARIAPGDVIRIAKSPDPTSIGNATWNNQSKTVTLAGALNADVEVCDTAWTASTDVTTTTTASYRKEGAYSSQFVVATNFTTGKIAYKALSVATDYSGYQQLSFWFRIQSALSANILKICLCSDTAGTDIVDEFVIPNILAGLASSWLPVTINRGSALGASIQSVAVYAIADPGAITFQIDNIIACKAAGSADSLSLTSLISKNSLATGGDEGWYAIQSIRGTTVLLDSGTQITSNYGRGYFGTTETVATYKRETIKMDSTDDCTVMDSGSSGSQVSFQGGYNTSNTVQDGETFFDASAGVGYGLDLSNKSYIVTSRINMARAAYGMFLSATTYCEITFHSICDNTNQGIYASGAIGNVINGKNVTNNAGVNIHLLSTSYGNEINCVNINNSGSNGMVLSGAYSNKISATNVCNNGGANLSLGNNYCFGNRFVVGNSKGSGTYGIDFSSYAYDNFIFDTTVSGNTSGSISNVNNNRNYLRNCTLSDTTKVGGQTAFQNGKVLSDKQDGSANNNYVYTDGGVIKSQAATRHTASGLAWQLSPTSANRSAYYPLVLPIARIAVSANSQVTVSCWFNRTNIGIAGKLVCRNKQLAGIDSDVVATMTAAQDTWEQLSISFTPTEAGVVEIEAWAYGGTTYSVYVDDIDYSQA